MGKVAVGAAVIGGAAICAAAALIARHHVRSSRRWAKTAEILRELEEKCAIPNAKLKQIADAMAANSRCSSATLIIFPLGNSLPIQFDYMSQTHT